MAKILESVDILWGRWELQPVTMPATSNTIKVVKAGSPVVVRGGAILDKVPATEAEGDMTYIAYRGNVTDSLGVLSSDVIVFVPRMDVVYAVHTYKTGVAYSVGDELSITTDADGAPIFKKAETGEIAVAIAVNDLAADADANEALAVQFIKAHTIAA